jgi:small subunit ribosomal protein S1
VLPRGLNDDERMGKLAGLVGERMPFKVLEVDPQRHRLVLSERKAIRQWRQDQKERVIKTLREGEVREGVVTSLREFGAFIDVGGADGLIHISELDWQHVDDPGDVLKIGQKVEVLVIRLDRETSRIGLSLKRMQPNPWVAAADAVKPGMVMDGKVTRIASSGAYVAVEGSLEGLIRSDDHLDLPSQGMNIQVRVLSFDVERERMDLEIVSDKAPMQESV